MSLPMETLVAVENYNAEKIKEWEEEQKTLDAKIKELEPLATEALKALSNTDYILFPLETKIPQLNGDIARILKGTVIDSLILGNLSQIKNLIFGDFEINAIQEEKKAYVARRNVLQKLKMKQQKKAEQYAYELKTLKKRKKLLDNEIPKAKKFLPALKDDPKSLVLDLINSVKATLNDFNEKHPKQDVHIRLCLFNLSKRLDKFSDEQINDAKEWRIRYAQLSGFLWDLLHQFEYKNHHRNMEFFNLLKTNLLDTHISEDADLPDDMKTGLTCAEHYNLLRKNYPGLFNLSPDDLITNEKNKYKKQLDRLREETKDNDDELYKKVFELANEVDKEVNKKRQPNEPLPDYKLYTRVLKSSHNLLMNGSEKSFNDFLYLKSYVSGQPSFSRRIIGLMSGIVSTFIATTSLLATALSFGTSAPITLPVVMTTAAAKCGTVLAAGASMGLAAGSWGFFSKSFTTGVARKMQQIEQMKQKENQELDLEAELAMKFA